jgi:predicted Zn finger-like uncharacterized protein
MIIECINCSKKFKVNADLIPSEGRNIQCGSCNHIWFFKKDNQIQIKTTQIDSKDKEFEYKEGSTGIPIDTKVSEEEKTLPENKIKDKIKKTRKPSFRFSRLLSYILVLIISFVAILLIIDTFKTPLYQIFPRLELVMYNFYETLKDISLFIKDLI